MSTIPNRSRRSCDAWGPLGIPRRHPKRSVGVLGGLAIAFTAIGLFFGLMAAGIYASSLSESARARQTQARVQEERELLRKTGLTEEQAERRVAGEWIDDDELTHLTDEERRFVRHSSARLGSGQNGAALGRALPAAVAALFILGAIVMLLPGVILLLIWRLRAPAETV